MPGAHRVGDSRYCGATTSSSSQSTVFVDGKLWAVEGDPNSHGHGELIASSGLQNVFIGAKKIIVAVGDTANPDDQMHPLPPTDPSTSSGDVFAY